MKIAIPEFNGRVAPTLDFCRHLLLVEVSAGELSEMTKLDFSEMESSRRVWFLKKIGVHTLLCGGISRSLAEDIEESGIRVIPWVSGEIQEVLKAYLMDRLPDPKLTSPGFHGGEDGRFHFGDEFDQEEPTRNHKKQRGRKLSGQKMPEGSKGYSTTEPADYCVCPKCGHRIIGKKELPCSKTFCPDCGSMMFRE